MKKKTRKHRKQPHRPKQKFPLKLKTGFRRKHFFLGGFPKALKKYHQRKKTEDQNKNPLKKDHINLDCGYLAKLQDNLS